MKSQTDFEILAMSALILGEIGFFHRDYAFLETLDILLSVARMTESLCREASNQGEPAYSPTLCKSSFGLEDEFSWTAPAVSCLNLICLHCILHLFCIQRLCVYLKLAWHETGRLTCAPPVGLPVIFPTRNMLKMPCSFRGDLQNYTEWLEFHLCKMWASLTFNIYTFRLLNHLSKTQSFAVFLCIYSWCLSVCFAHPDSQ